MCCEVAVVCVCVCVCVCVRVCVCLIACVGVCAGVCARASFVKVELLSQEMVPTCRAGRVHALVDQNDEGLLRPSLHNPTTENQLVHDETSNTTCIWLLAKF